MNAFSRKWWSLPFVVRGILLIVICFGIDTGIGNASVVRSMIGACVIGALSLGFVFIEGRHRRSLGNLQPSRRLRN